MGGALAVIEVPIFADKLEPREIRAAQINITWRRRACQELRWK